MFEIEYVAVRDGSEPLVVEKVTADVVRLVDADKTAKSLLEKRYTSRGLGVGDVAMRFNCRGKISLITLRRS
jgi:predicted MPP superfamily phosphohydrolase